MKQKKTFSNWLTNRYLLIIRNEEDFAEKTSYNFTYAKVIVFSTLAFLLILAFGIFLVNTALSRWFDPRYAQMMSSKKIIYLTTKVDSLAMEVERKDDFINSFKTMLSGGEELAEDSQSDESGIQLNQVDIDYVSSIDSQIRKEFEGEQYDLAVMAGNKHHTLLQMYFFKPLEGVVTNEFSAEDEHYGVDIVANKDEPVKSVSDGTVVLSSWTDDTGYVIAIQHSNNLISMYKHNAVLLKKLGDFVEAGEIIAIIGNSGELTTGPHLHLELWYSGNPVDPKDYISL